MPATPPLDRLPELLQRVFGHRDFRPHQQPVCEAAASGRDVLLVMPTGAGKSLCYQLPALARDGTALVISPLIALMDDQASKLSALNLRVARIHSGLPREAARQACRDYLDGNLDFLFIAPERLRVPGFPEMLAKRKPALIAIDEAHCISQWGHDFRPDYRTLGQYLPALRPAPVIALTATATPAVQHDIVRALDLTDPSIFITGFRRTNLHIEVSELSKPQRTGFITRLLANEAARPAIVYASSRKSAEELAGALRGHFPVAAYHAGLDPGTRERVQNSFLAGKLEVVVATVAFGMGVDKSDIRTVVHAALPGSVEAYYQEIGRAGRDGLASRAVLLHGFADRKTQEFLLERNYPQLSDLERVAALLSSGPRSAEELLPELKLDREAIERCIEKLVSQGAATSDFDGTLRLTNDSGWQREYDAQVRHRREQIDRMVAYAEGTGCRMSALVRHFGDRSDAGRTCGICDACNPSGSVSSAAHQPSASEKADLLAILGALKSGSRATGRLFTDLKLTRDRKHFDSLLDGLARAGLVHITTDNFRAEDGRDISYRKASLTPEGRAPDDVALSTVWLRSDIEHEEGREKKRLRFPVSASTLSKEPESEVALSGPQTRLFEALREWRVRHAQELGIAPFMIFHDSVLRAIAASEPKSVAQLKAVRGVGPEKLDRFGVAVLSLCRGESTRAASLAGESSVPSPKAPLPRNDQRNLQNTQATWTPPDWATSVPTSPRSTRARLSAAQSTPPDLNAQQQQTEVRLREWRRELAAQKGLPTFFVLSESALRKVVAANPQTLDELRSATDLGGDKLAQYGAEMLALCRPA